MALRSGVSAILAILLLCPGAEEVAAQEPAPTAPNVWSPWGPAPIEVQTSRDRRDHAGRIVGIAPHPSDPNVIYIASAGGGVWRTADAGLTWVPLTDSQPTLSMGSIAVARSSPSVIYAGTGDANWWDDSNYGRGVLVSTDGGSTWTLQDNGSAFDRRTVGAIAVDPTQADVAYAAVSANGRNGLAGNTGIWKTIDGGLTWVNTTAAITTTAAWSTVVVDPRNPSIVYAAVGEIRGAPENGLYKSTNGGTTWSRLSSAPSGTAAGRMSIAVAESNPLVVYVSTNGTGEAGSSAFGSLFRLMRSDDGGTTFTDLTSGTPNFMGQLGWHSTVLIADPSDSAVVFAAGTGTPDDAIRSADGGLTWTRMTNLGQIIQTNDIYFAAAFDAAGRLIVGSEGVLRLQEITQPTWRLINGNLSTALLRSAAFSPSSTSLVLATTEQYTARTGQGGLDSPSWGRVDLGGGHIEFSATTPGRVYHQAPSTGFFRRSDCSGSFEEPPIVSKCPNFAAKITGITDGFPDLQIKFAPFVVDPRNGDRVLYGARHVWETTNAGETWRSLGQPFPANVDALALSPSDPNVIYVAAGPSIFSTLDGGATWTQRSGSPGGGTVAHIEVDPRDPMVAYAVLSVFNGAAGNVFRTTDGFATWENISGNLPSLPTWSLELDPERPLSLYVGNDTGVFSTLDGGVSWERVGQGLPNVQVLQVQLVPDRNLLAAATHGRGLWVMLVGDRGPTLTVDPSASARGQTVSVAWSGLAASTPGDWIGLYRTGAADTAFLDWTYISCSQTMTVPRSSGSCSFTLSWDLGAGGYEYRLFAENGFARLASSTTLVLSGGPLLRGPLDSDEVVLGETVRVTWFDLVPASATHWIGFHRFAAADGDFVDWMYLSCVKAPSVASESGSCSFTIPLTLPLGPYQFRLFADNSFVRISTGEEFGIRAVRLRDGVVGASTRPGSSLPVSWANFFATPRDWIGLYRVGSPADEMFDWMYTSCSKTPGAARPVGACSFVLPATLSPGSYEFRLYANDTSTLLANDSFRVDP